MLQGRVQLNNGIELAYDAFGEPGRAAALLVMGLGTPRHGWDEDLCRRIAGRGLHVVRFDNRDVGESTRGAPHPDLGAVIAGEASSAPYRLEDMADDAVGCSTPSRSTPRTWSGRRWAG